MHSLLHCCASITCVILLSACTDAEESTPLQLYGAASLASVLPEAVAGFSEPVEVNFAASSVLARQLENGAPADVFVAANPQWMDYLNEKQLLRSPYVSAPWSNRLVLVAPKTAANQISMKSLSSPSVHRIAVADWQHVPAGMYARQALTTAGLWDGVQEKLLPAMDVRAALMYVEQGAADCGIVYHTDAAASRKVKIVATLAADTHMPIRYSMAVLAASNHPKSQALFAHLQAETTDRVLEKHGFVVLADEAKGQSNVP